MKAFWYLLIAGILFLSGCTTTSQDNPGNLNITSPQDEMETGLSGFNEVKRVITSLYNDQLIIGDDRYFSLKEQLDIFESQGIGAAEISDLRKKLETLKPTSQPEEDAGNQQTLQSLENEINEIIAAKRLVGPDHYQRMLSDLDTLEREGADAATIAVLQEKLSSLDPAQYNSTGTTTPTGNRDQEILDSLPPCTGQKLTVSPVDQFTEISPLGNLAPPGHTIPTEHLYIHISGGRTTTSTVPLKAPGDVYLLSVSSDPDDIAPERSEYVLRFALCKDVFIYFNHVKGISDQLKTWLSEISCEQYTVGSPDSCTKQIFQKIPASTVIGEVGHLQGNFDLGAYDYRTSLSFANPDRYGELDSNNGLWRPRSFYIVCPLDLFEDSVKNQLLQKITGSNTPKCGKTIYDVKGTLQGNWFFGNARADIGPASGLLSFVYDNENPSEGQVSIGGTLTDPKILSFTPSATGTINRKFDQVTADGKIYCYSDGSQKVIAQLTKADEIKAEYKQGGCSSSYGELFTNPYTYQR